jgi:hypothetical protein
MVSFSIELLTILVLISISLAGITFIAVLIISIIYIYSFCSKRRQLKSIKPIPTHSTSSVISIDNQTPAISPVPIKFPIRSTDKQKKLERHIQHYDENSVIDEQFYLNNKNKYQQQEYIHDENDETTTTINENQIYRQRHQKRQHQQSMKPLTDIRILDRHTPYPPDVIAREKLMNITRFPMDNKY